MSSDVLLLLLLLLLYRVCSCRCARLLGRRSFPWNLLVVQFFQLFSSDDYPAVRRGMKREVQSNFLAADTMETWRVAVGKVLDRSYVFNGDFVDRQRLKLDAFLILQCALRPARGAHSLEVIGLLLALKVLCPAGLSIVGPACSDMLRSQCRTALQPQTARDVLTGSHLPLTVVNQVWLVRGNHEDRTMNARYGFWEDTSLASA